MVNHQGDGLGDINGRPAPDRHDGIRVVSPVSGHPGRHLGLHRVSPHPREDRGRHSAVVQHPGRAGDRPQGSQALVGDDQRARAPQLRESARDQSDRPRTILNARRKVELPKGHASLLVEIREAPMILRWAMIRRQMISK